MTQLIKKCFENIYDTRILSDQIPKFTKCCPSWYWENEFHYQQKYKSNSWIKYKSLNWIRSYQIVIKLKTLILSSNVTTSANMVPTIAPWINSDYFCSKVCFKTPLFPVLSSIVPQMRLHWTFNLNIGMYMSVNILLFFFIVLKDISFSFCWQ